MLIQLHVLFDLCSHNIEHAEKCSIPEKFERNIYILLLVFKYPKTSNFSNPNILFEIIF